MIKLQQTPMRGVEDNLKIALSDTAINKLVGDLNKRSTYRVTIVAYG
jgi:K+/H+ antiporter YhaU regulatory subunit KhtT